MEPYRQLDQGLKDALVAGRQGKGALVAGDTPYPKRGWASRFLIVMEAAPCDAPNTSGRPPHKQQSLDNSGFPQTRVQVTTTSRRVAAFLRFFVSQVTLSGR